MTCDKVDVDGGLLVLRMLCIGGGTCLTVAEDMEMHSVVTMWNDRCNPICFVGDEMRVTS